MVRRGLLGLLLLTCLFGTAGVWAADSKVRFNLRPDEFPKAILEFYHQSKIEVLFRSNDSLRKIRTQPVVGEFEPREALELMLQGTGLTFEFDTARSVIIRQPQVVSAPPPAAPRTLESSVHHLAAVDPAVGHNVKLEEVLVTGSLIHTAMDVQAPLVYVTQSDISRADYPTVQDALYQLPINSLNAPREDLGLNNNYNYGTAVNLRGLGVGATLVLVNGYRQPLSGLNGDFVDVSNIPGAAVERIEILPDGASALYGSDAIAGVVNIVLKDDFQGAETQVRYGGAPGGLDQTMVSQLLGTHWDTGKAMFVYEYSDGTDLAAAARGYAANADKVPYGGADYRTFYSDPGNILSPSTLQPIYGIPAGLNGAPLTASALSPTINLQNQFAQYQIFPQRTSNSVYGTGSQQVGDDIELFAQGRFTQRSTYVQRSPEDEMLAVPSTNPFNPFGTTTLVAYSFGKSLGPGTLGAETRNYMGTVGARFKLGAGWRATLSESYGRERLFNSNFNQVDPGALNAALADTNAATAFNAFGGATNPATLAAIERNYILHATSGIETTSFIADGPLFNLPAGAAKMAVGLERREESLDHTVPSSTDPEEEFADARYSRHVGSAFTELSLPLVGDAANPHAAPRLELTLAGRYEDYSDFGHTANPEFRLRWTPTNSLKLRASWGRSFRAPTLDNLSDSSGNLSFLTVLPDPKSPTGQSTVLGLEGDNPNLKQETATTWTAGFDVVPETDPGLKLSLTYYAIDFENQIAAPDAADPFDILIQQNQWAAVITRNPTLAQIAAVCNRPDFQGSVAGCLASSPAAIVDFRLANLGSTRVSGLDLDVHQSVDSRVGRFDFGLNGSYVFHFDQAVTDTSPSVDILNTIGNPLKLRLRATADWNQHHAADSGLGASLAVNFTNGYDDPGSTLLPRIDSLTTVDVQLRYRTRQNAGIWGGMELSLNAVNVFNQSPPFVDDPYGYDTANFQALGRVLSLSLRKKW
jgi:iron complex outermembrane recepter protein